MKTILKMAVVGLVAVALSSCSGYVVEGCVSDEYGSSICTDGGKTTYNVKPGTLKKALK